ncbi:MAG: Rpn family recombination-promoting nuclease/putative transposase [Candidatus Adiutrix sp.]|jgi:predicted transposase/invertase (TIGR01784 family)|nr:Rpn family recombination-promoting nuclease/putative transposase [Candidatus Adiutrix sp.]
MTRDPLSPKNDLFFKLLFAEPNRLSLLQAFLRAALDLPAEEFDQLTIMDPHLQRGYPEDKLGILDAKILTKGGQTIDVEIQVEPQTHLWERALYYAARMTTDQLKSGRDYREIHPVIGIFILDWELIKEDLNYHHRFRLYDERLDYAYPRLMEINILELPKLPERPDGSSLCDWLRLFTARTREEFEMAAKAGSEIAQAVAVIMELSEDERTRMLAESRERYRRDEVARREYAVQEERLKVARAALRENCRWRSSPS